MKNIFTCACLLMALGRAGYAQEDLSAFVADSTKLYVEYAYYSGYANDSIYKSLLTTSLFVGRKGDVSVTLVATREEVLAGLRQSIENEIARELMIEAVSKDKDLEKKNTAVYAKYFHSDNYYELKEIGGKDYWVLDSAAIKWRPLQEFKVIDGYKCQKAIGINYKNQQGNLIAWFTEEIPVPSGPFYIGGLPGLILEYSNPNTDAYFKARMVSSTNIPDQKFRAWLGGAVISTSDFYRISGEGLQNFQRMKKMMGKKPDKN